MLEKTPKTSKKFIAFFFALILLAGIAIFTLCTQSLTIITVTLLSLIVFGIIFISVGYILSQNALDKLVRGIGELRGNDEDTD